MAAKKEKKEKNQGPKIAKGMGLEALVKSINKHYGEGTLMKAGESKSLIMRRVPFNIFDLDSAIGGGVPCGRITMIKGEFSTGKSGLCLKAAASFQRHCRFCTTPIYLPVLGGDWEYVGCSCGKDIPMVVVWMDAEHSFDRDWAIKWDVNVDDMLVIQTEYAEQAIDVADACIRSQDCDLLVVDSIAALTPSIEVIESSEKWQVGVMARLMNKALRKWTSGLNSAGLNAETQCTIMLINQMRLNLGGYHVSVTSPGGKGLDFYESLEIRLKRVDWVTHSATQRSVAADIEYRIPKNKTAPAMREGAFRLYFVTDKDGGYRVGETDLDKQVLRLAVFWGFLKKGGSWFTFPDGEKFQGESKAAARLREDPEMLRDFQTRILDRELAWTATGDSEGAVAKKEDDDDDS